MGRYHPRLHDEGIRCDDRDCGVMNAPEGTDEFEPECWRCGKALPLKPTVGDVVEVDVIDVDHKNRSVTKTESGFVLFLECEVGCLEARVKVTNIEGTSGTAEFIEEISTTA